MKRILISTAVIGLAVAGIGTATAAPSEFKVTGGGQITLDSDGTGTPPPGPGQTIAFSALSAPTTADPDAARGQVQFNDHLGNKFHGVVTCLAATPTAEGDGVAVIGGFLRDEPARPFRIDVMDNGEGQDSTDMIALRQDREAQDGGDMNMDTELCDMENEGADMMLGRGNVQVQRPTPGADGSSPRASEHDLRGIPRARGAVDSPMIAAAGG